jgi:hypothetical protein
LGTDWSFATTFQKVGSSVPVSVLYDDGLEDIMYNAPVLKTSIFGIFIYIIDDTTSKLEANLKNRSHF